MWCKNCNRETYNELCELCGEKAIADIPTEVYYCTSCKTPIIKYVNDIDINSCTLCNNKTKYLSSDLRPVFPEERLLYEVLEGVPFKYLKDDVWASKNRIYINGKPKVLTKKFFQSLSSSDVRSKLDKNSSDNTYDIFNTYISRFLNANRDRYSYIVDEAFTFIQETATKFPIQNIVVSFSGGKDSTVTADLVVRALSQPSIVHIYGDTTLEFPLTEEYAKRFKQNNPQTIFKVAKNKDQNFYEVCADIGPPARMLRWCCSMFKTGPITRVINNMYRDTDILTFYGIRKYESVSRSKYNRYEDSADAIKIQKQKVASPIFPWKDIDIWLYILTTEIDFNDAYRLGYDRVGCWCCPNNNDRAQFLASIYMPEQYEKWRSFLVNFAKSIGKPDAEEYIDSGAWKARQGGNGITASQDVKLKFANCTTEDNAKIYQLNKEIKDDFIQLFTPFGRIAPELGRKLVNETIIVDKTSGTPILSIQPYSQNDYDYSVKIKTMNVAKHDDLHRMASYQVKKYNACRKCLKCESLCKFGAISIFGEYYLVNEIKCKQCKMCVTAKYLDGGCTMDKYLRTKV